MNPEILRPEISEETRVQQSAARMRLAAEVEAVRRRLDREGGAPLEKAEDSLKRHDDILSVADVMPEAIEVFGRLQRRFHEFAESIRQDFEAAPNVEACKVHPLTLRKKDFEASCTASRAAGKFVAAFEACPDCLLEAAIAQQRGFWRKRGVPERVIDATFENFVDSTPEKTRAVARAQEWCKDPSGVFLVLLGTPGTGKTHLAVSALRSSLVEGLCAVHQTMMAEIHASYVNSSTPALIERWQSAPVLVIDEFGLERAPRDEEAILYAVIAVRHDRRLRTIITANLTREDFRERMGYRLVDRVQENCELIVCAWESFRRNL